MILKKIMVEGQEVHIPISKDEAKKCHLNNETLLFTDEEEKKAFFDALNTQTKNQTNYQEPKPRMRTEKLLQLLPFLDDDNIHELFEKIINDDASVSDLNLPMILPFLNDKDASALFEKAFYAGNTNYDPLLIAPFVSEKTLSLVVDQFLEGKISSDKMDQLYPFLSREDLNRLFKHIMSIEK